MVSDHARPRDAQLVEIESLRDHIAVYRDRRHAGQVLTHLLAPFRTDGVHVLAIPAGGVCVAAPIAAQLALPLGLLVVGRPHSGVSTSSSSSSSSQDVFGAGALVRDGHIGGTLPPLDASRDPAVGGNLDAAQHQVQRILGRLNARTQPRLDDEVALVVDHGMASGATIIAAVAAARRAGAPQVWVAVPTAPDRVVRDLSSEVDRIFCPNVRSARRFSVADAYERWGEIDEAHVLGHLRELENVEVLN